MTTWIFPSDTKEFDTVGAFSELKIIDWATRFNVSIGDIVYIYCKGDNDTLGRLVLKSKVTKYFSRRDQLIDDRKFWKKVNPEFNSKNSGWVRLELLGEIFDDSVSDSLSYYNLLRRGLKSKLQGQIKLNSQPLALANYINEVVTN